MALVDTIKFAGPQDALVWRDSGRKISKLAAAGATGELHGARTETVGAAAEVIGSSGARFEQAHEK
ncbi:MAG: hypothetical protein IKD28_00545, partial [Clostridia bacterium]|nr:hypothetical protein [Clostridia bacterium]